MGAGEGVELLKYEHRRASVASLESFLFPRNAYDQAGAYFRYKEEGKLTIRRIFAQ